jgi:hypothetical protein
MNSINIEYILDKKTFVQASRYYSMQMHRFLVTIIRPLLTFILGILEIFVSSITNWNQIFIILGVLLVALSILDISGIIHNFIFGIIYKKTAKFHSTQKIIFSDNGLDYTVQDAHSNIYWSYYQSFMESDTSFLLIYGKNEFSVIPKSSIKSTEVESLRKLMQAKLKEI